MAVALGKDATAWEFSGHTKDLASLITEIYSLTQVVEYS